MNKHITLVIDEKTADFLLAILNSIDDKEVVRIMENLDTAKEGMNFIKEMSEGIHANGWCKDENCLDKQNGK